MLAHLLVLVGFVLALIAVIQVVAQRGWLPESTLLALVGMLLGGSYLVLGGVAPHLAAEISPLVTDAWPTEAYLWIFLPPLIFQAALTTDVRSMMTDAAPILLLAVVAVFVATGLIGGTLALASGMGLALCLLVGAVVATTDPSAVIAVFRSLGAPPRLVRLVEGESLLNDAAAIAIAGILLAMLSGRLEQPNATGVAITLAQSIFGGGLAGYLVGRGVVALLPFLARSPTIVATLTLAIPYPLYVVADEILHASGVIAVVSASLVISAFGPTRLSPRNWGHLHAIWQQIALLCGAAVFLLAAMRVPSLLQTMDEHDLFYVAVVFVAALGARLAVLFGMLPALSWMRLSAPVDMRYKLAISWGGLRGAVTLVLALSIAENPNLPLAERQFVGALACSFVLASLFINGLTLRWVVKSLGLTKLSHQQEALQRQAAWLSVADVNAEISKLAENFSLPDEVVAAVQRDYQAEVAAGLDGDVENALTERERLSIGLIILATKEHNLIPKYGSGVISPRNLDLMMRNTGQMIDSARQDGRLGYSHTATTILKRPLSLRLGEWLSHRFHFKPLLLRGLVDRFELLICRRAVLQQVIAFNTLSLRPFVGDRMTEVLEGILRSRLESLDEILADLRSRYGGEYAEALEKRLLTLFALNSGTAMIEKLKADGILSSEVAASIVSTLEHKWRRALQRPSPPSSLLDH